MPHAETRPDRREESSLSLDTVRNATIVALILLLPFAIRCGAVIDVHSPHFQRGLLGATTVGLIDIVLIILSVLAIPLLVRRDSYRDRPIGLIGMAAFATVTLILLAFQPSLEGLVRFVRFAGITGAIAIVRWMLPPTYRAVVIWPLTFSVGTQAAWALAQTFVWRNGHESGITRRFDHSWTQGYGSMDGAYALAAFMVLGIAIVLASGRFRRIHPLMWLTVVLAAASISGSFGRQGVLAAFFIAGLYGLAWLINRKRDDLAASLAVVVPMSIGIAVAWDGWQVRAAETAAGQQWGREALLNRAFGIIEANPLFGVGPGNYGPTLARTGLTEVDITMVHNVPVLVAAEYGVPAGILFVVWIGLLGISALFTSVRTAAVFVAIAPYLVFDHPHIAYAYGIAEFGLWLSVLDYHRSWESGAAKQRVGLAET